MSLTAMMIAIALVGYLLGALSLWPVTRRLQTDLETAHHDLRRDRLTGLRNRDGFTADHRALTSSGTHPITLLADIDGFKAINDTFGHQTGDEVLTTVAHRIKELAELYDGTAARFGGDEFAVLIPAAHHEPSRIADALTVVVGQPITSAGISLTVTVSVGYTDLPGLTESLRAADVAMYHAKHSGPDRPTAYQPGMTLPTAQPHQRRNLRDGGVTP